MNLKGEKKPKLNWVISPLNRWVKQENLQAGIKIVKVLRFSNISDG
jgi:hypothetical protein